MDANIVQIITDVGAPIGSLLACFWYIRYQTDQFAEERSAWMIKDSESDEAMRSMMRDSNSQLMNVLQQTNLTLKDMTVALSELKETIHRDATK